MDYCNKELAEATAKNDDKSAEISKLSSKIDTMSSRSAALKGQAADLQNALANLARSQAQMDKIRKEDHDQFVANKADLEQGLVGVKLALKVLGEYYSKDA